MTITTYTLRAASAGELHAMLAQASADRARAYAWTDEEGTRFDEARVRLPYPEMVEGATDPDTGLPAAIATGEWLCSVALVDETDSALAGIAERVTQ